MGERKSKSWGFVALWLAVGMLLTFYKAWALTVLWSWFVVPAFHLPQVGIVYMFGLVAIVRCIVDHNAKSIKLESRIDYVEYFVFAISYPLLLLGVCKLVLMVF